MRGDPALPPRYLKGGCDATVPPLVRKDIKGISEKGMYALYHFPGHNMATGRYYRSFILSDKTT